MAQGAKGLALREWWPLAAGIGALLLVSYARFAQGIWNVEGNDHAPVLVAITLFLLWRGRHEFAAAVPPPGAIWPGVVLAAGLLVFVFGVRTRIAFFESLSHVVIVAGAMLLVGGAALLRKFRFALSFLLLSAPIPSFVLAMVTAGLKMQVTTVAVELLYALGYPIADQGTVITMGHYQLLVAEACAGMNSIISLSAVGLVYLYLAPPQRTWQLVLCLASIIPIAIAANVLRIVALSLITYYLGDEAGQGFLHEFAGIVMFLFSLVAVVLLSMGLQGFAPARARVGGATHA
jgi:exosortase